MTPREFNRWKAFHAEHPLDDRQRLLYPASHLGYFAATAFGGDKNNDVFEKILHRFVPALKPDDTDPASFAHIMKVFKEA